MTKKRPAARIAPVKKMVAARPASRPKYFSHVSQISRAIVGAVLVFSAATKLLHPVDFAIIVQTYQLFPSAFAEPAAALLPWIELLVGGFIFFGLFSRIVIPIGGAMLAFFVVMMGIAFAQGKSVDCGCFVGVISEQVGPLTLVRDMVIFALAIPAYLGLPHKFSLETRLGTATARLRYFAIPVALAVVAIAFGAALGIFAANQPQQPPPQLAALPTFSPSNQVQATQKPALTQATPLTPIPAGPASDTNSVPAAPPRPWRLGPESARVVISEFGDYQCPGCRAIAPVLMQLVDEYHGDVTLVFRHFPLSGHDFAVPAALAAEAAGEQGKFWEMHDLMYADQLHLSPQDLISKAAYLKLDMQRFDEAVRSERVVKRVQEDYELGVRARLKYTPWIQVNDKLVQPNSYEAIKAAVDAALKK